MLEKARTKIPVVQSPRPGCAFLFEVLSFLGFSEVSSPDPDLFPNGANPVWWHKLAK